jgi:hypothetical protein
LAASAHAIDGLPVELVIQIKRSRATGPVIRIPAAARPMQGVFARSDLPLSDRRTVYQRTKMAAENQDSGRAQEERMCDMFRFGRLALA